YLHPYRMNSDGPGQRDLFANPCNYGPAGAEAGAAGVGRGAARAGLSAMRHARRRPDRPADQAGEAGQGAPSAARSVPPQRIEFAGSSALIRVELTWIGS